MTSSSLSPSERKLRARIAALTRAAKYDGREVTAAANAANRSKYLDRVDPDRVLPAKERQRRADALRAADMARLAFLSVKARRRRAVSPSDDNLPESANTRLTPAALSRPGAGQEKSFVTTPDDPKDSGLELDWAIGSQMWSIFFASSDGPTRHSRPRSEKRGRGKAADTIALGQVAHDVLADARSAMTLRQLYYALVSVGAIPKVEPSYDRLKRVMKDLREDGTIPWDWLVDHTRAVFAPRTFDGVEGLLTDTAKLYRRDLMRQQKVAIQLWAESDSIGSVIAGVADRYCVPTFIGRGYSARGYLWAAAKDAVAAHEAGKTVHILHVGDFDPSGEDIYRDVEETLRLYAIAVDLDWPVADVRRYLLAELRQEGIDPAADLYGRSEWCWKLEEPWTHWLEFERLALTAEQIDEHNLPTRPPKTSDVRTAKFTGSGTVEVEDLPVDVLLNIVETAILDRIDETALADAEMAEQSERDIALRIAGTSVERLLEAGAE